MLGEILLILFYVYLIVVILVVLMEDRSVESSIAWIMVLIVLPFVGLILYIFFGRDWKRLSKRQKNELDFLNQQSEIALKPLLHNQKKYIEQFLNIGLSSTTKPMMYMAMNNSGSLLTMYNDYELLQDGKLAFPDMIEQIKKAKKFVHLMFFIWTDTDIVRELVDVLIQKAKMGVEVRILFDFMGGLDKHGISLNKKYKNKLKKHGIKIQSYFDFLSPGYMDTINYRNHRKIVVIDNKIGFTGGMNMSQEYFDGADRFPSWRDTFIRLEGEVVSMLENLFATNWYQRTKENLFLPKYTKLYQVDNVCPMQLVYSGPDSSWAAVRQVYTEMISDAQKYIYIQSPYFILNQGLKDAYIRAALSGVDVRVMMTGLPDKKAVLRAAYTYYKELLQAGVKIYQYKKGFLHSKNLMMDDSICSVGTANMDIRSFVLNYENIVLTYDQDLTQELKNDFYEDIKHCEQITIEKMNKLGFFTKLRNSLCRLFSPLM